MDRRESTSAYVRENRAPPGSSAAKKRDTASEVTHCPVREDAFTVDAFRTGRRREKARISAFVIELDNGARRRRHWMTTTMHSHHGPSSFFFRATRPLVGDVFQFQYSKKKIHGTRSFRSRAQGLEEEFVLYASIFFLSDDVRPASETERAANEVS